MTLMRCQPETETRRGTVTYVFAVCRAGDLMTVDAMAGHDVGTPVRLVEAGGVLAVAQDVPPTLFSAEALRQRLSNRDELERFARAHHAVVCAAAARATTVPLPMATLYRDEDRVREALSAEEERFRAALDGIEGRAEWGLKIHLCGKRPPERVEPGTAGSDLVRGPSSGRAYLDRARGRQRAQEQRRAAVLEAVDLVDQALREASVAARRLRVHEAESTGRWRAQLLNAAYLVPHERDERFVALVEQCRRRMSDRHLEIDLSGPWPAYSFVAGGFDDA